MNYFRHCEESHKGRRGKLEHFKSGLPRAYRALAMTLLVVLIIIFSSSAARSEDEESVFDVTEGEAGDQSDESIFNAVGPGKSVNTAPANISGYYDSARIIVLNKITANSKKMTIPVASAAYFNNAEIKIEKCWKSPDQYKPNSQMLITVVENKFDDDPKVLFHGWIISSDPALSTMEHPVYEVLATECAGNRLP